MTLGLGLSKTTAIIDPMCQRAKHRRVVYRGTLGAKSPHKVDVRDEDGDPSEDTQDRDKCAKVVVRIFFEL